MKPNKSPVLVVAVDLTPMKPGGANGGVKPAILALLVEIGSQAGDALVFLFLTNSTTHEEARGVARPCDLLVCVEEDPACRLQLKKTSRSGEFKFLSPPDDLLDQLGVDILYRPFASSTLPAKEIPVVALITDLLQRDFPLAMTGAQVEEQETCIQRTLKAATRVQSVSRSGVERLMAHYPMASGKLFYTYLPVHARLDTPGIAGAKLSRKLSFAKPFFFYPADLRKHKNHETLLLAYRLYREQAGGEAWDLVLTFPEDKRAGEIKELIEILGIADTVHLPGYVTDSELRSLWQKAGALVFPSLHEGLGLPLLEAMHYGAPILSGHEFSLKEIVGDAYYPMDPRKPESIAEALSTVSRDPALRKTLIGAGKERLSFFDLPMEARKLLEVLKAVSLGEGNVPRKNRVFDAPCGIKVPLPASEELWSIETRVAPHFPQNRYSVFLDDSPFGSFSPVLQQKSFFHFGCRPQSRLLRIMISRDSRVPGNESPVVEGAIDEVVARSAQGDCVILFKSTEKAPA